MKKHNLIGRVFGVVLAFMPVGAIFPLGIFDNHNQVEASPATIYVPDIYPTIQAGG